MENLKNKKCVPCEGGVKALTKTVAEKLLTQIQQWQLNTTATEISREFSFKDFHQVMAFANAIAWIANQENHHPDLELSYNHAKVHYSTHAIKGLSENDFICAAKIDELIK
jgi:4a-hydroxytetrahydrobiopterin dehydratase